MKASTIPRGERNFRADDGQADLVLLGELDEPRKIGRREIDVLALGLGAGVARRDEHPFDAAALRDFPGERMFASAVADHKHFHRRLAPRGFGQRISATLRPRSDVIRYPRRWSIRRRTVQWCGLP